MASNYNHSHNVSGWVGWLYFAGTMMMLAGAFQAIAGLVAIFKNGVYVLTPSQLVAFDYRQWGFIHLIIGILLILSAISLFAGRMWGRILAIFLASLSAIANFTFIQANPWWSLTVIVIDILIIYGVAVHGGEIEDM